LYIIVPTWLQPKTVAAAVSVAHGANHFACLTFALSAPPTARPLAATPANRHVSLQWNPHIRAFHPPKISLSTGPSHTNLIGHDGKSRVHEAGIAAAPFVRQYSAAGRNAIAAATVPIA
jgi:hypothetical protein